MKQNKAHPKLLREEVGCRTKASWSPSHYFHPADVHFSTSCLIHLVSFTLKWHNNLVGRNSVCLIAVRGEEHKSRKISNSPHRAQSISRKSTKRGKEKRKGKKEHEDAPSVSAEAVCFGPVIQQGMWQRKTKSAASEHLLGPWHLRWVWWRANTSKLAIVECLWWGAGCPDRMKWWCFNVSHQKLRRALLHISGNEKLVCIFWFGRHPELDVRQELMELLHCKPLAQPRKDLPLRQLCGLEMLSVNQGKVWVKIQEAKS